MKNAKTIRLERALPIGDGLDRVAVLVFVVQVVLSVNPNRPQWSDVALHALPTSVQKYKQFSVDRDVPMFQSVMMAREMRDAINETKAYRARVVARHKAVYEELVD